MSLVELLRWQREGYPRNHSSRANLLLHIVVVPLFLVGNVTLILALVQGAWAMAGSGLVAMIISVIAQGRGHKIEILPPEPFTGPTQAVQRIFFEQWVTFPWFLLSGGWWRALRAAA